MKTRLKELRKSLGLTMEEFGANLGVKKNTISQLESGKNNLTEQMILSICREFNVSEEWLRNGVGDMFIESKEDYLNSLSQRYHLDDLAKSILEGYFSLKPEHRDVIKDYIFSVAEKYQKLQDAKSEIDQEVEAYRKELEAEAKGAAGLSQSEEQEGNEKIL